MWEDLCADYHISEEERARWLRSVLVDVVQWLAARPYAATYQRHCNRWRERESGPLCVCVGGPSDHREAAEVGGSGCGLACFVLFKRRS